MNWEKSAVRLLLGGILLLGLLLGLAGYSAALGSDPFGIVHFAGHLSRGKLGSDYPVYSWFKPEWAPGEAHFVLHGNYVASAAGIHCKYTIGFPLILAGFIRVFGPGSVYYANVIIFVLLLAAEYGFAALALRSLPRKRFLAFFSTALLAVLTDKFWQLALRPAADLSGVTCLVGGCGLLALGLRDEGRTRWGAIASGAFCFGLAASVRLPNVLAVPPAGIYLLWRLGGRGWKRAVAAVLLAATAFSLGLAPALYQNRRATGNPLKPPRPEIVERNPLKIEGETTPPPLWLGFFRTTAPETARYFWRLYGPFLLGLVVIGLWRLRRSPEILCLGLGIPLIFVLFYSMWVHLMTRYMMVAHPFALLLAAAGAGSLLEKPRRLFLYGGPCLLGLDWWVRSRMRHAYALGEMDAYVLAFGAVLWLASVWRFRTPGIFSRYLAVAALLFILFPVRYLSSARAGREGFQLPQAARLGRDIDALAPPGSVILATKPVSQFIELFSSSHSLRPFEMDRMGVETFSGIAAIMARGHGVYLLETSGWKRDAAKAVNSLKRRFDLVRVGKIRGGDYNLGGRFGRDASVLWRLEPWSRTEVSGRIAVPGEGPWLLGLDARAFSGEAAVELGGECLNQRLEPGMNFFPVPRGKLSGSEVEFRVAAAHPLPADLAPRLRPLEEPWPVTITEQPDFPAPFAEDGFAESRLRDVNLSRNWWNRPGKILIPTPEGEGEDMAVLLRLAPASGPRKGGAGLKVFFNGVETADLDLSGLRGWGEYRVHLPRHLARGDRGELELVAYTPEGSPPSAGEERIGAFLFDDVLIERRPRRLEVDWPASAPSFLAFRLDPARGQGSAGPPYVFYLDGQETGRSQREGVQRLVLPPGPGRPAALEVFSLAASRAAPITAGAVSRPGNETLRVELGTPGDWAFVENGFYPGELFAGRLPVRWSARRAVLVVPVFPDRCRQGEVVLRALDLAPPEAPAREAAVRLEGVELGRFRIRSGQNEYRIPFVLAPGAPRLAELEIEAETWRPADYPGGRDGRSLGLMLAEVVLACGGPGR